MAFEVRHDAKHNRRQQWPPRFCLRRPQQVAQAPLSGPTLLQGTGVEELRWFTSGPTPGTHGRVVA